MPRLIGAALVVVVVACGGDTAGPAAVASIAVTSPTGARMAVGRTTQLAAVAHDAHGGVVTGVTFTWTSSAFGIAQVDGTGLVSGLAAGSATLSAQGAGVTGTLAMQVVVADLNGITAAISDPFTASLVAGLSTAVRDRVQAALTQCTSGAVQGNFTTIESCLASARAEVAGATDPTDRALLATLALYFDHVERLLDKG